MSDIEREVHHRVNDALEYAKSKAAPRKERAKKQIRERIRRRL